MKPIIALLALISLIIAPFAAHPSRAATLGVGVNYWQAIDDIELDDFDEDGLSFIFSSQFKLADLTRIEAAFEWFDSGFGGSEKDIYAPQAFLIFGTDIYIGVGAGLYFTDGEFLDDTFYALRAGIDLGLLPFVDLELNANYRFENWDEVNDDDIDTNTIMLGAAVRFEL